LTLNGMPRYFQNSTGRIFMGAKRSNRWKLSIFVFAAAGFLAALAAPRSVRADAAAPNVTGNGASQVKLPPQVLRMQMLVAAQGKDLKEGLTNLKAMEAAVGQKLAAMGAAPGDVHWGDATVEAANSDRQRQMARMAQVRTRGGQQPTTSPAEPTEPVKVLATLRVDFPLTGQNNDELLQAAHDFQTKIKEASLAAPKTAAEAEEAEEDESNSSNGAPPPGTPYFEYVHKVTDEERAKATADAFARARDDAARLAKAAGAELGPVQSLSDQVTSGAEGEEMYGGSAAERWMYSEMQEHRINSSGAGEVIGPQPGDVSLQVAVVAAFALK
jgi:uncharacterized protein YggE